MKRSKIAGFVVCVSIMLLSGCRYYTGNEVYESSFSKDVDNFSALSEQGKYDLMTILAMSYSDNDVSRRNAAIKLLSNLNPSDATLIIEGAIQYYTKRLEMYKEDVRYTSFPTKQATKNIETTQKQLDQFTAVLSYVKYLHPQSKKDLIGIAVGLAENGDYLSAIEVIQPILGAYQYQELQISSSESDSELQIIHAFLDEWNKAHQAKLDKESELRFRSEWQAIIDLASKGAFEEAIQKATSLDSSSPFFQQSRIKISEWNKILEQRNFKKQWDFAYAKAAEGNLDVAIHFANQIPTNSPYYGTAQLKIKEWQKIHSSKAVLPTIQENSWIDKAKLFQSKGQCAQANKYYLIACSKDMGYCNQYWCGENPQNLEAVIYGWAYKFNAANQKVKYFKQSMDSALRTGNGTLYHKIQIEFEAHVSQEVRPIFNHLNMLSEQYSYHFGAQKWQNMQQHMEAIIKANGAMDY